MYPQRIWFLVVCEFRALCPQNLRAAKERMVLVNLVEGNFHDIVLEYEEEGGPASLQVSLLFGQ